MTLRVLIAEDQALLRQGIVRLLADAGFEVVAEAADAPDLLRKVAAHKPDVAIVDVQMPPDNTDDGLRAAMEIRATQPGIGVLVLSQYAEERYAVDLIGGNAEGVGYLLKDRVTDFKLFADAVQRVAAGGSVLDPTVVAHMLGRRRRDDPLKARGYEVVGAAEDLASAHAAAAELRPDCVLLDVNLPDGDGVSAANRFNGAVVVLVSTLDESAVGDVEASGAKGFVPKAELASPRLVELLGAP